MSARRAPPGVGHGWEPGLTARSTHGLILSAWVSLTSDFATALSGDEAAQRAFGRLSYSQQQRHVLSITSAKAAETRQRRIATALAALRQDSRP